MRGIHVALVSGLLAVSAGCGFDPRPPEWQRAVAKQSSQLGYNNWIVICEASFPAQNRRGVRQVTADVSVPEALDYVLSSLESTQHVSPRIYVTRELRSLENDNAPGIDFHRKKLADALHGHESIELDQQSLVTLLDDANRNYDVLVVRTTSALPYASVFIELQPGYWDAENESRLRERIQRERMDRITR